MTQRIFDIENEKDYTDLWDIIPENIVRIRKGYKSEDGLYYYNFYDTKCIESLYETAFLLINWHDKTRITRPVKEATEQDVGKLCKFWDNDEDASKQIGLLTKIRTDTRVFKYSLADSISFTHCCRLTKQEIEELI